MKLFIIGVAALISGLQLNTYSQDIASSSDKELKETSSNRSHSSGANLSEIIANSRMVLEQQNFIAIENNRNNKMKASLGQIHIQDNTVYFKIRLSNQSPISFDIDFIKFHIKDLKTAKRTVTQEQELTPVYLVVGSHNIPAQGTNSYVFALNKFTLARDKALFIEIYERGGGRHLLLKVNNNDLNRSIQF